jgi:hypothetical protein
MQINGKMVYAMVLVMGAFVLPQALDARPVGHCPPGLAKKAVPCVPPGQVQNAWKVGARLPQGIRYVVIDDYWRYGLPRPSRGTQYVRVDNDILRIAVEGARVIESLQTIGRLLN